MLFYASSNNGGQTESLPERVFDSSICVLITFADIDDGTFRSAERFAAHRDRIRGTLPTYEERGVSYKPNYLPAAKP